MESRFTAITDTTELEQLFARSHDAPVLLFKHSNTCPISAAAYKEVKEAGTDVALVVVQKARLVSRAIEERTGVRHESPQALVLSDGAVVWTASHWNITAAAVNEAMKGSSQ